MHEHSAYLNKPTRILKKTYLNKLSTCISTISKFDTIQYRSNFLFRILLRFDIYRNFYIEFQLDKIHNFEFSISNFDIAYLNTVKTNCRWRYRKREKESKERKRETKRQRDKETKRQRDKETKRQRDKETKRQRDKGNKQRDKETKCSSHKVLLMFKNRKN